MFEDNTKAWSGDHCVDPLLVPGVLFSNRKIDGGRSRDRGYGAHALCDCSASNRPAWMEGKPVSCVLKCAAARPYCFCCCCGLPRQSQRKVIVLGVDGMDPGFVERHWDALPESGRSASRRVHAARDHDAAAESGGMVDLHHRPGSSGHGIFDFVHRDPATLQPYSSMQDRRGPVQLAIGPYILPLSSRGSCRFGKGGLLANPVRAWHTGHDHAHARKLSASQRGRELSGMGTPDLRGTLGTFSFYTDDPEEWRVRLPEAAS